MKPLSGALVGFGAVAENAHVPAFRAQSGRFRIDAVVEAFKPRQDAARKAFPEARIFDDLAALFNAKLPLDFVDIATPPHLHAQQATQALAHKLHVLCEKPLVLRSGDFETLKKVAADGGRSLFTVHNWKFAPLYRKAWELLDEGVAGDIRHVELHVVRTRPAATAGDGGNWRADPKKSGGGVLVDHGWHQFYLLQNLVRKNPLFVKAVLKTGPQGAGELEASVSIEFPDTTANVYLTWLGATRRNWGVVYGSEAILELHDDRIAVTGKDGKTKSYSAGEKISAGSAHPEWFERMLEDFHEETASDAARYVNMAEAEICQMLIEHCFQSHRLGGRTVPLPVPMLGGRRA